MKDEEKYFAEKMKDEEFRKAYHEDKLKLNNKIIDKLLDAQLNDAIKMYSNSKTKPNPDESKRNNKNH